MDKDRGKDAMLRRFGTDAMNQIVQLTPFFANEEEANKFYRHFLTLKRVKDHQANFCLNTLPTDVMFTDRANTWRCTSHAEHRINFLGLSPTRRSKMQIFHLMAHFFQPEGSKWHGGEFGSIFLDLVERDGGPDMKRQVKDIMIKLNLKTSVRSEATRMKQSQAYYNRKVGAVPKGLLDILREVEEIRHDDG